MKDKFQRWTKTRNPSEWNKLFFVVFLVWIWQLKVVDEKNWFRKLIHHASLSLSLFLPCFFLSFPYRLISLGQLSWMEWTEPSLFEIKSTKLLIYQWILAPSFWFRNRGSSSFEQKTISKFFWITSLIKPFDFSPVFESCAILEAQTKRTFVYSHSTTNEYFTSNS